MIGSRCGGDGADLVTLPGPGGCAYRFCPVCSTASIEFDGKVRIRWRYRAGDLCLLDPPDPRADRHVGPLRDAVAEFLRVGLPFVPACHRDGSRVPVVAEAERLKLVWCSSCKAGTAYGARPKYGWMVAGVFSHDGTRGVLEDYFGPAELESIIEAAVAEFRPAS